MRRRQLRVFVRRGLLPGDDAQAMEQWQHGGGFSVDGSVCIAATDRAGRQLLPRYPRVSRGRLHCHRRGDRALDLRSLELPSMNRSTSLLSLPRRVFPPLVNGEHLANVIACVQHLLQVTQSMHEPSESRSGRLRSNLP